MYTHDGRLANVEARGGFPSLRNVEVSQIDLRCSRMSLHSSEEAHHGLHFKMSELPPGVFLKRQRMIDRLNGSLEYGEQSNEWHPRIWDWCMCLIGQTYIFPLSGRQHDRGSHTG
jgi:hypothetical protein